MPLRKVGSIVAVVGLIVAVATPAVGLSSPAQAVVAVPTAAMSTGFARDVARLDGSAPYDALVQFRAGSWAERRSLLTGRGLDVTGELRSVDTLAVRGPVATIAGLQAEPSVQYIEDDAPLRYFDSTAHWATGVGVVQHAAGGGPYRVGGAVLDGAGIGVAVVDSGVDATHPDLAGAVVTNRKTMIGRELEHTDSTSGHGTHVSGIIAGSGAASQGTYRGVAPAADLHVFSAGEVLSVFLAATSLETIYTEFDRFSPRIQIVNNSWGDAAGSSYDPQGTIERIVRKLVLEKGVTVIFAAGNDGCAGAVGCTSGAQDQTSGYCKDPTSGVICVANYDDDETGNADFELDSTSSTGRNGQPATYPDVSAPGSYITSTMMPTSGALYGSLVFPHPGWAPYYGDAGGTSMAAPHVAGIAALLLQANPALTPADVEDVFLDTAHKFTAGGAYGPDPQNAGGTTSFDKGAGLADAVAALRDPRIGLVGDAAPSPSVLIAGDGGDYAGFGAADLTGLSVAPSAGGISYTMTIADAEDRPPVNVGLRVFNSVGGNGRRTTVNLTPAGTVAPVAAEASDDPATAEAQTATRDGNAITFFVPYSELGDPPAGKPVFEVWAATYMGFIQDVAPSPASGPPQSTADFQTRPLYTAPFTTAG